MRYRVLGGARTPFGRAKGMLRGCEALDLARTAAEHALALTETRPDSLAGLILAAGIPAYFPPHPARELAHRIGLPARCLCLVELGGAAAPLLALARGLQCFQGRPFLLVGADFATGAVGNREGGASILDRASMNPDTHLTLGADADAVAAVHGIARSAQDSYAVESHHKAWCAREDGVMAREIVPMPAPPDYETLRHDDEAVLPGASAQQFGRLSTFAHAGLGTATHGNLGLPADGAAAVVIGPEGPGLPVRAVWAGGHEAGVPDLALAVHAVCAAGGVPMDGIAALELHERSAAHVLAALKVLGFGLRQKVNRAGGAIAVGDVAGATALRHTLVLAQALGLGERGIVAACSGGVCGAVLLEGAQR